MVGFKIGNELDVMKAEKAQQSWRKIIARMRYNCPAIRNGIDVTTPPRASSSSIIRNSMLFISSLLRLTIAAGGLH